MRQSKLNAVLFLVLACLLIFLLAIALPGLVLLPAQPFAFSLSAPEAMGYAGPVPDGGTVYNVFRGLLAVMIVLFPMYVIVSLSTRDGRKRLIFHVLTVILLFAVADYLQKNPPPSAEDAQGMGSLSVESPAASGDPETIPIFSPDPPSWLSVIVVLAGSLLLAAIILALVKRYRQPLRPGELSLEQLAEEAQSAILSLQAGEDFRTTILRCYREMNRVVQQERGMARDSAMTAREFEQYLIRKGLPPESTITLTRLFEQVRYGHLLAGPQDTTLAVACLTRIVDACQLASSGHE